MLVPCQSLLCWWLVRAFCAGALSEPLGQRPQHEHSKHLLLDQGVQGLASGLPTHSQQAHTDKDGHSTCCWTRVFRASKLDMPVSDRRPSPMGVSSTSSTVPLESCSGLLHVLPAKKAQTQSVTARARLGVAVQVAGATQGHSTGKAGKSCQIAGPSSATARARQAGAAWVLM